MRTGCRAVAAAVALISLVLATRAQAQDAPPLPPLPPLPQGEEGGPPPPPPPPPPMMLPAPAPVPVAAPLALRPATRYSRYRSPWYIGIGLGGGAGWVSNNSGQSSDSQGGVSVLVLKVGLVLQPNLLLGFEGSAWRYQSDAWVQFNHYDAMLTLFPGHDSGFYLKGGVGAGVAMFGVSAGSYNASGRTDAGFDLKVGLGHEWQVGPQWNFGLEAAYAATFYPDGRSNDVCFNVTFSWY
ncbi:MAG TPA: outer membrane beta-barrel protein [Polyangia bacterium]|jgi:hypothetical protein